eukprot:1243211-Pyramimonas_sp.AAC.1
MDAICKGGDPYLWIFEDIVEITPCRLAPYTGGQVWVRLNFADAIPMWDGVRPRPSSTPLALCDALAD